MNFETITRKGSIILGRYVSAKGVTRAFEVQSPAATPGKIMLNRSPDLATAERTFDAVLIQALRDEGCIK